MLKIEKLSICLICSLLIGGGYELFYHSNADGKKAYQELLAFTQQTKHSNHHQSTHPVKQQREKISKQILYTKEGKRLQSRLTSECSELVFDRTSQGKGLVEYLENVSSTMQEKLIDADKNLKSPLSSSQQVARHIVAEKATYFYQNGQVFADEVELFRYLLPHQNWVFQQKEAQPLFKGSAKHLQFCLLQSIDFKAQDMRASFIDWSEK